MNKKTLFAVGTIAAISAISSGVYNHTDNMRNPKYKVGDKYGRNGNLYEKKEFTKRSRNESLALAGVAAITISASAVAFEYGMNKVMASKRIWRKR